MVSPSHEKVPSTPGDSEKAPWADSRFIASSKLTLTPEVVRTDDAPDVGDTDVMDGAVVSVKEGEGVVVGGV